MTDYHIGVDTGGGKDITVKEWYMYPTADYPQGSYMRTVAGKVEVATGFYEREHPDHPSPYWHGGAPFFMMNTVDWDWPPMPEVPKEAFEFAERLMALSEQVCGRLLPEKCG